MMDSSILLYNRENFVKLLFKMYYCSIMGAKKDKILKGKIKHESRHKIFNRCGNKCK